MGAVVCAFLSLVCVVCSFSVSLFYPTSSSPSVDTPGFAFIVVCLAALLTVIAVLLACYGVSLDSVSGFKNQASNERNWKLEKASSDDVSVSHTTDGSNSEVMPETVSPTVGDTEPTGIESV